MRSLAEYFEEVFFKKTGRIIKKNDENLKKNRSVEIFFFLYSFILCGSLENDPLSPRGGSNLRGASP
jgi:hypothetical protein